MAYILLMSTIFGSPTVLKAESDDVGQTILAIHGVYFDTLVYPTGISRRSILPNAVIPNSVKIGDFVSLT